MKFIADENIPLKVVERLKSSGIEIESVVKFKPGMADKEIVKLSSEERSVIITFDKDFGELIFKNSLKPYGVILLRIQPKSVEYIYSFLFWLLTESKIEFENKFVVAREDRIREIRI